MKNLLEKWKAQRNLTLFGKVHVIKCLAMSGLIYTATNCAIPSEQIIKDINKILYEYLWGKTELIRRSTLVNDKLNGGIGMIDVQAHFNALKAAWIPKIMCKTEIEHWKEKPLKHINKLGPNLYVLNFSTSKTQCPTINCLPVFYKQVVNFFFFKIFY